MKGILHKMGGMGTGKAMSLNENLNTTKKQLEKAKNNVRILQKRVNRLEIMKGQIKNMPAVVEIYANQHKINSRTAYNLFLKAMGGTNTNKKKQNLLNVIVSEKNKTWIKTEPKPNINTILWKIFH
jgi:hypothetical protein